MQPDQTCPNRDRRTFLGVAAATALVGSGSALPSMAQGVRQPLELGLIRNPVSGLIEVAAKKGWMRDAGVELKTTLFTGAAGPKVIQAMGGGSLSMSTVSATAAILAMANEAVPLRIVSIATDPVPLFMLLSAPGFDSMRSLAGKRVSAPQGTGLQYFLVRSLSKHGMSLKDIEYVNLPAGDAQAAFLAGRIDAVVPSLIGALMIQKLKPDTRRLFTNADFTKPPGSTEPMVNYDVFVASEKAVTTQKEAVAGFLGAYHDRAVPYLRNPTTSAEAIKEINDYVNTEQRTPTDIAIMRELLVQSGFHNRQEAKVLINSDAFLAGLDNQMKFFVDSGQLKKSVSMKQFVLPHLL